MTTAEPAVPNRRARLREATIAEIKHAALEQIRTTGPAGLSLRAVGREVGMSGPGLYRYFANREDLMTALIADAYHDFAAALKQAHHPDQSLAQRCHDVWGAYFDWARQHQVQYNLMFAPPIPGYAAPTHGPTVAAAIDFSVVPVQLMMAIWHNAPEHLAQRAQRLRLPLSDLPIMGHEVPHPAFVATMGAIWSRLHGIVTLGLHGHLRWLNLNDDMVRTTYTAEIHEQLHQLGVYTHHERATE